MNKAHAKVRSDIEALEQALQFQEDLHNKAILGIRVAITEVRKNCPHPEEYVSYHPDPSGNNDSHYECSLCGRESSRHPNAASKSVKTLMR